MMKKLNKTLLAENIRKRALSDMENGKIAGMTIIVNQNGERVFKETFTNELFGEITDNTMYRLASMTKPVTAVAIMILRDRGLLSIEDPISKYLPAFAEMNIGKLDEHGLPVFASKAEKQITIRDLLTHSSGLGSDDVGIKEWDRRPEESRYELAKCVDFYAETLLGFEPATKTSYSPVMGFDVLGRIVEVISGKTLEEFFQEEIFKPLGMNNTTFEPTDAQWENFVQMHNIRDGKVVIDKIEKGCVFENIPHTYYCGAGGLASTAEDYSKFAEMLLGGKGILKEETLREMSSPQLSNLMKGDIVWGLGMRVIVKDSYKDLPVGSFGWSGAYGTHFWVDPANKITAIYMKNSHCSAGAGDAISRMFECDVTASFEN